MPLTSYDSVAGDAAVELHCSLSVGGDLYAPSTSETRSYSEWCVSFGQYCEALITV